MTGQNKLPKLKGPFFEEKKEQAEAGRSPALLALRYRCGCFAYPPGILEDVLTCEIKEKRILYSIRYNWITAKI